MDGRQIPLKWLDLDIQVQRSPVAGALTLRYGHKAKQKKGRMEHGNHIRLRNIHDYWVAMNERWCFSVSCNANAQRQDYINAIAHGAASTTPTPTPMLGGSSLDPSQNFFSILKPTPPHRVQSQLGAIDGERENN